MSDPKTKGEMAFDRARAALKSWDELPQEIKDKWEAAAKAEETEPIDISWQTKKSARR
jgi:hypothetical protein